MQTSALFDVKTSDFQKFMLCLRGQGGSASAGTLRGQFYAILCRHLLRTNIPHSWPKIQINKSNTVSNLELSTTYHLKA